jgi:putative membrane protein
VPDYTLLPTVNAALNTLATIFILRGWRFIRRGEEARHRVAMVTALACSALFLASYLVYHAQVGSRPFTGTGALRAVYFFVLVTHVVLAAAIVPLVILTVARAVRGDFARHRAVARWTLPLWLYVSVTGVVVYLMLYRLTP